MVRKEYDGRQQEWGSSSQKETWDQDWVMVAVGTTHPSVIERARAGDAAEFARLYAPLAYAMARKGGLDEHDAADIMQQTMLEVLRLLPKFQYDRRRGTFKGLLKKIVCNRTSDLLRHKRQSADHGAIEQLADATDAFAEMFERQWKKAHLTVALDRVRTEVKPSTFQSFQLVVLQERPVAEVSDELGLSPNQIAQNKHRVLQRLRAYMEELLRDTD